MDLLFLLWFYILPPLAMILLIVGVIGWFFLMPGASKLLFWARFQNVILHFIADASGLLEIVKTKERVPEGVELTNRGWRFLPQPLISRENPGELTDDEKDAERITLKPHILKTVGKPVFLDYAGKVTSMSFTTLAALQQRKNTIDLNWRVEELEDFGNMLPKGVKKDFTKKVKELQRRVNAKPLTPVNPEAIREIIPDQYSPTQIEALAENRYQKGMRKSRRDLWPLILGGAIIIGVVIIGALAIITLGQAPAPIGTP